MNARPLAAAAVALTFLTTACGGSSDNTSSNPTVTASPSMSPESTPSASDNSSATETPTPSSTSSASATADVTDPLNTFTQAQAAKLLGSPASQVIAVEDPGKRTFSTGTNTTLSIEQLNGDDNTRAQRCVDERGNISTLDGTFKMLPQLGSSACISYTPDKTYSAPYSKVIWSEKGTTYQADLFGPKPSATSQQLLSMIESAYKTRGN